MSISSGSYTVGSGGNYATWKAAIDDIGSMSGDITLTQIANVTETAAIVLDHAANGFTLKLKQLSPHLGVYSGALKTNFNFTGDNLFSINGGSLGTGTFSVEIDGLAFFVQSATSDMACIFYPTSSSVVRAVTIKNNLFNLNSLSASAFSTGAGPTSPKRIFAFNNKAFAIANGKYAFACQLGSTWENNTYYGTTGRGFGLDGLGIDAFNNASYGEVGFAWSFGIGGEPVSRNNASSDDTARVPAVQANNYINRSATVDFISTDSSSSDFLKPSPRGPLLKEGATPTVSGNSTGIDANPRPSADRDVSVGAHQALADHTFVIGTFAARVRNWPRATVKPAILWMIDATGNPNGSDRGASQDVYESEVVFYDTEANMNALETALEVSREGITLSSFTAPIFSPNVDHTGSISATVTKMGRRKQIQFGASSKPIYELAATFRAIAPTLLSITPGLSTLKLQEGFEAGKSFSVTKTFSYDQTPYYQDSRSDDGKFRGVFRQRLAQAQAVIAYVLVTARASTITFPTLGGLTYPFGITKGASANCKITKMSMTRRNFVFWDIELEFTEVA